MKKTQAQILKHHGGDGEHARTLITQSYARRHDDAFWQFWNKQMGSVVADGDILLDLGAGTGQFVKDLATQNPNNTAMGIDAADYMLSAQEALPANGRIVQDNLNDPSLTEEQLPLNSVATMMANMLVHELPQPILMFKAAFKWLKPGGRFCIIDLVRQPLAQYINHKFPNNALNTQTILRNDIEDVFDHFLEHNRYHADDIIFMLTQAGFNLIENTPQRDGRFVRIVVEKPV